MPTHASACPCCGLADHSYKVSLLFQEGTARLSRHETNNQPELDSLLSDLLPVKHDPSDEVHVVSQVVTALAPPETPPKSTTRGFHPDWMIPIICLAALLLIYQVATQQPKDLTLVLSLSSAGLLIFILLRRPALHRYQAKLREEQEAGTRSQAYISRWMRLYFCSRDRVVFDPDQGHFFSLEQVSDLWKIS